jgi:hypothetical protein
MRRIAGFILLLMAALLVAGGVIGMSGRVFRDLDGAFVSGLGLAAAVLGLLIAVVSRVLLRG